MITNAILVFFHGLAVTVANFLSSVIPAAPSFISQLSSGFTQVYEMIPGPMRNFLPIGPTIAAGGGLVVLIMVLGVVKFARRVLSLFTGGGGNA